MDAVDQFSAVLALSAGLNCLRILSFDGFFALSGRLLSVYWRRHFRLDDVSSKCSNHIIFCSPSSYYRMDFLGLLLSKNSLSFYGRRGHGRPMVFKDGN